ncbi:MAG: YhcH/YjgK/YiaL family protein [Williamsia sp.]|nr:YhcH/YjgK/YiaL family protein [Williamsia sp.]
MTKRLLIHAPVLLWFLTVSLVSPAQTDTAWTKKKATEWFNGRTWMKGVKLAPSTSIDKLEFARQYQANRTAWEKTFSFLAGIKPDTLHPGKYIIDGDDAYADVTDNPSTPLPDAKWHSHRKYCDIQLVLAGKEKVGVAPVAGAQVVTPFDNEKGDAQFYNQDTNGTYYTMTTGTFYIFFPTDAHRPFIKVDGVDKVKRMRIKVKARTASPSFSKS